MKTNNEPLLEVRNLTRLFPIRKSIKEILFRKEQKYVRAVDNLSFQVAKGEVLGLAGESGSGKTTTGKLIALLETPTGGEILFKGQNPWKFNRKELKTFRKQVQMIFQDPFDALDPRIAVFDSISEALDIHKMVSSRSEKRKLIVNMLEQVHLTPPEDFLEKYPHQLSGGQRQRVAIARAMIVNPELLIADEAVSMLDASARAGFLNLLLDLRKRFDVATVFVAHDLAIVRYICDRVAIMYNGKIMELGEKNQIFSKGDHHPYTEVLLGAVPILDPSIKRKRERRRIQFETEAKFQTLKTGAGCRFANRCVHAMDVCTQSEPEFIEVQGYHYIACHRTSSIPDAYASTPVV